MIPLLKENNFPFVGQTNVNAELWSSDNTQVVGQTQANAALTTLTSSGANTFSGYIMIGKIWM
jgi:hypothetical protein